MDRLMRWVDRLVEWILHSEVRTWLISIGVAIVVVLTMLGAFTLFTVLKDGDILRNDEVCHKALVEANELVRYGRDLIDGDSALAADGFDRVADRYLESAQRCREEVLTRG